MESLVCVHKVSREGSETEITEICDIDCNTTPECNTGGCENERRASHKSSELRDDVDESQSSGLASSDKMDANTKRRIYVGNKKKVIETDTNSTEDSNNTEDTQKLGEEVLVDDYGFLYDDQDAEYPKCHDYYKGSHCDQETEEKWRKLLEDDQWEKYKTSGDKIRSYVKKGVPFSCRGRFWLKLLDAEMLAMKANFSYKANVVAMREQLVEMGICEFRFAESLNVLGNLKDKPLEGQEHNSTSHFIEPSTLRQIFCDIERTYPIHVMFSSRHPWGRQGCATLFRVLAVYARYNNRVGYCQGMSYIAGLLLMEMAEAEAFWCLVALFERPKYLQGFYDNSLGKVKNYAAVFKKVISYRLPELTKHLRSLELQPLMFLTPWFMCLFTELQCWDTVLLIWDLFLLDGASTLFRVALAILDVFQQDMLRFRDLSSLLPELLHLPHKVCRYESLVPAIWQTNIEQWEVKSLLAVVSEEEVIRQKRKRITSEETTDTKDGAAKRQKVQPATEESPSLLRRFINFFTGKSIDTQKPAKASHTQRLLQRAASARASRRRHLQAVNNTLASEEFGATPGTPTEENFSRAQEDFSFKMFHTPVPVRRSQARKLTLPLSTVNSPEVELESMTNRGRGTSTHN